MWKSNIDIHALPQSLPKDKKGWVIHIQEPEPVGTIGGADVHLLELTRAQQAKSIYEPLVIINQNDHYAKLLEEHGISYIFSDSYTNKLAFVRGLSRIINLERVCLIHTHGYDSNYIVYLINKLYPKTWGKKPIVMTCHGWVEDSIKHRLKTVADFITYRLSQALIICSPYQRARLNQLEHLTCIEYIPNGIFLPCAADLKPTDQLVRRFGLPEDHLLVAAIGRLSPEKSRHIYIEACKYIAQSINKVHFLVVGAGDEQPRLEALAAAYQIQDKVTFTGLVTDIETIYRNISLLIQPSDTESTSRVVAEAMSFGVPVIATRVGGTDRQVEHGLHGYLVDRGDAKGLAQYAIGVLSNPHVCRALGDNARTKALEQFSIWKMQQSTDAVYDAVLASFYS